jgi:hypothetical protein
MANIISTCSNTPVLEVLKVLPLLGIQVRDGSNHKCRCEIADKRAFPCAYPTSDGGETRLLVVQEVSHDNPDFFMSLIVDGMDQNTTMVPKMRQTMKNIESRFVKTHLCGVLVHSIGLYADVWIDAHHKHDSNQVIMSVMHVIADVRRRKDRLPPTLRIQADNCTRENKNIYMFVLCAALMGLGYFQEVQLYFL